MKLTLELHPSEVQHVIRLLKAEVLKIDRYITAFPSPPNEANALLIDRANRVRTMCNALLNQIDSQVKYERSKRGKGDTS